MSREYPERPIIGVGAVIIDGDQVLLVKRGNEPLKGEWSLPGGALELGETLEDGIRREVLEETGLIIEPVSVVEVLDHISRDAEAHVQYHYVLVDYLCRVVGGALMCASDAADARWGTLEDLGPIALITAQVIRKAFRIAALSPVQG